MKGGKDIMNGQIDIFDLFEDLSFLSEIPALSTKDNNILSKVQKEETDYLKKGERIASLAKEKYKKFISGFSFSDLETKLFSVNLDSNRQSEVSLIASRVIRPALVNMTSYDENDPGYKALRKLISDDYDFSFRKIASEDREHESSAARYLRRHDQKCDDLIMLTVEEKGWAPITVIGYRCYSFNVKGKNMLFKDGSHACDIATLLSYLILISMYNSAMSRDDLEWALRERLSKYTDETTSLANSAYADLCVAHDSGMLVYLEKNETSLVKYANGVLRKPVIVLDFFKYKWASEKFLKAFEELFPEGFSDVIPAKYQGFPRKSNSVQCNMGTNPNNGILLKEEREYDFALINPYDMFQKGVGYLSYNRLLPRMRVMKGNENPDFIPESWSIPVIPVRFLQLFWDVLSVVFETTKLKVETAEYFKKLQSKDHAKSYQTKKNIPKKTVKEMENSAFNDFFGYVEFDERVDLAKADEIRKELAAFLNTYLKGFDLSEISLRFRRLGNHNASGLYYPYVRCLCVDIDNPSSMIHELGHCIDHTASSKGDLSLQNAFYPVYSKYGRLVKREMKEKHINPKGKYNLSYFLLNTEAFARCWEIYVTKVLEISNSICTPSEDFDFAYPTDEDFVAEVKEYFDCLLKVIVTDGSATEPADAA